jgi:hypothetical protein
MLCSDKSFYKMSVKGCSGNNCRPGKVIIPACSLRDISGKSNIEKSWKIFFVKDIPKSEV